MSHNRIRPHPTMTWQNLSEDIAEDLGNIVCEHTSGGFTHHDESYRDENYQRWYKKFVWYPKNREMAILKARQRYLYNKMTGRLKKRKRPKLQKGTEAYRKKLEWMKAWKKRKYQTDPAYRDKVKARNRVSHTKRMQSPEYRAKRLADVARRKRTPENRAKAAAYLKRWRDGKKAPVGT